MEQPTRNVIGRNVRRIRTAKEFSQERLAVECARLGYELPRAILAKIESGIRGASDVETFILAHALRVEISDLFPGGLLKRVRDGAITPFHRRGGTEE
jgi:transcriptional regulator with XRE-family HTH domain